MRENFSPAHTTAFYFDCPLCGKPLDVRMSKKQKPYVTCDGCSLQMFVRGRAGIERFDQLAHRKDGKNKAAVGSRPLPRPKGRPGRPRKETTARAERFASRAPVTVLLTGGPHGQEG